MGSASGPLASSLFIFCLSSPIRCCRPATRSPARDRMSRRSATRSAAETWRQGAWLMSSNWIVRTSPSMSEDLAQEQLGAVALGVGEELLRRSALDDLAAVHEDHR